MTATFLPTLIPSFQSCEILQLPLLSMALMALVILLQYITVDDVVSITA